MKITIKRSDIVGPYKLPGFNGIEEINLEEYIGREIEIPKGYKFESLGSLDVQKEVDETDDVWSNDGVRELGNIEERIEALQESFCINGYKILLPGMGSRDSNGKQIPVEGRGRAIGSKRNKETKIPWINLIKTVDGNRCRISAGVLENLKHDPATKATREDIITAGLTLISCGELAPNEVDIMEWLKNDIEIFKYFQQRNVTIILNSIDKRHKEGDNVVKIKSRKIWEQVLEKEFKVKIDDKRTFLYSVDSGTFSKRCISEAILDHGITDTVEIVLYTNQKIPSQAREGLKKFVKDLESRTRKIYKVVGNRRDTEFKNVTLSQHYVIKGCIPQFLEDHKDEIESNALVDLKNY